MKLTLKKFRGILQTASLVFFDGNDTMLNFEDNNIAWCYETYPNHDIESGNINDKNFQRAVINPDGSITLSLSLGFLSIEIEIILYVKMMLQNLKQKNIHRI